MSNHKVPSIQDFGGQTWRILRFADQSDKRWSAFNPSIAYSPEQGYVVLLRSSNYFFDPETTSTTLTVGARVQSRMWLGTLDSNWQIDLDSLQEIDFSASGIAFKRGAEDGRLYWVEDHWEITAGLHEEGVELPRIARFRLNDLKAELLEIYRDGDLYDVEKNWMAPAIPVPEFDYIYNPVMVYQKGVGPCKVREVSELIRNVRGGSQLQKLPNGNYIAIVHEADVRKTRVSIPRMFTIKDVSIRTYVHRFAIYNHLGALIGLGPRFKLSDARIEFAAGLVVFKGDLIVSYGYKDVAAYLAKIKLESVLNQIKEV